MGNPDLGPAGLWAFRLTTVISMMVVDDPIRLAFAALLLALQIPVHARIRLRLTRV
jgi:hypothetical protein